MRTAVRLLLLPTLVGILAGVVHFAAKGPLPRLGIVQAVRDGNVEEVRRNLNWAADVNAKEREEDVSLLQWARRQFTLRAEADAEEGGDDASLLHLAAGHDDDTMALLLLDRGAQVDVRNKYGQTPLHGCGVKAAALLLARGADVNARSRNGWTPLHMAAAAGNAGVAEDLVHKGADLKARDNDGMTPLQVAVKNDQKDAVDYLSNPWPKGVPP